MPKTIVLYTSTGCPLCARYRALFDEHGRVFEERNTTDDPLIATSSRAWA